MMTTVSKAEQQKATITPKYTIGAFSTPSAGTNASKEKALIIDELAKLPQNAQGSSTFEATRFRGKRIFGLTTDVSGDSFLLTKEINVPGFLGASQGQFEPNQGMSFDLRLVSEELECIFLIAVLNCHASRLLDAHILRVRQGTPNTCFLASIH
jgi:hypothetical protein